MKVLNTNENLNIMKKILVMLLLGSTLLGYGQQQNRQMGMKPDFTPEQQAILKTKQMTLDLDLSEAQQKQILDLNKKWAEEKMKQKEAVQKMNKDEMTDTERFNHMNDMLDKRIAHQNEVKKILSDEQYELWKKSDKRQHFRSKQKMAEHRWKAKGEKR